MKKISKNFFKGSDKLAYINVPKDILKIREKYFLGLNKRELFYTLTSAGIGIILFKNLKSTMEIECLYLITPIIIPLLFLGFYEDNGTFFEDKIKNYIYFYKNKKPKVYKTENWHNKILIVKEINKILSNK